MFYIEPCAFNIAIFQEPPELFKYWTLPTLNSHVMLKNVLPTDPFMYSLLFTMEFAL